jgi:hypothetical protein
MTKATLRRGSTSAPWQLVRCRAVGVAMMAAATVVSVTAFRQEPAQTIPADVIARASAYVRHFEEAFGVVIADEAYLETLFLPRLAGKALPNASTHRSLSSEMLFLWMPDAEIWLGVRHVLRYSDNGGPWTWVSDKHTRLDALLKEATGDAGDRLRQLADEGARFNLGRTFRNFAAPTFTIQFLDPSYVRRFAFTTAATEKVGEAGETIKLAFMERTTPTIIRSESDDVPASGAIWIRPADGAVVRTSLTVAPPARHGQPPLDARMDVEYRRHAGFDVWVPTRMSESYRERVANGESVECTATYSNFRRFETSVRILPPK